MNDNSVYPNEYLPAPQHIVDQLVLEIVAAEDDSGLRSGGKSVEVELPLSMKGYVGLV